MSQWRPAFRSKALLLLGGLSLLVFAPGLGGSGRLTYHEAIWAQVAREGLRSGSIWVPTLDGRPWLEKPPLEPWLIEVASWCGASVNEFSARLPSAVAAVLLALAVFFLVFPTHGSTLALLAACVQVTSAWLVMRGRLAEADVPLACILTWTVLAAWRVRSGLPRWRAWRWAFFALLGFSVLAKGLGFGAVLVGATVTLVLLWDRDFALLRKLCFLPGWALAGVLALPWPLLVWWHYPAALDLWVLHVADRLAARPAHFVGEPWWQYGLAVFWQTLPWTPLALAGAWRSWRRARRRRGGLDRLLWAWAIGPAALVSLASTRNAHYLIYALPPWSVWAAMAVHRLGARLRARGLPDRSLRMAAVVIFTAVGVCYGLGFAWLGPRLDRRGVEWAFYERAGRIASRSEPLVLLYDDWDRKPYPNPFGPMPHDLAVRLYYLNRPACWRLSACDLLDAPPTPGPFAVVGRDRDVSKLKDLGQVQILARGPVLRADRTFLLFRVVPEEPQAVEASRFQQEQRE